MHKNLEVEEHQIIKGVRPEDYEELVREGFYNVGAEQKYNDPKLHDLTLHVKMVNHLMPSEARVSEPVARLTKNEPFDQKDFVSCGSEAGERFTQNTITDSMLELR